MRTLNKTRLCLESLEDRCTPSAALHALDLPDSPGHGHAVAQTSQIPAITSLGPEQAELAGNVISTFARDAHGVRIPLGRIHDR
jgi:hypothetical protein